MKKDKAHRMVYGVLRHVHQLVGIEKIKNIVVEKSHKVRNIYNIEHKIIKNRFSSII